jgi:universal stress protein A
VAICEAAQTLGADLIVISTHGYTGFKKALLGSTTERVAQHAPCPVLVMRASHAPAAPEKSAEP